MSFTPHMKAIMKNLLKNTIFLAKTDILRKDKMKCSSRLPFVDLAMLFITLDTLQSIYPVVSPEACATQKPVRMLVQ